LPDSRAADGLGQVGLGLPPLSFETGMVELGEMAAVMLDEPRFPAFGLGGGGSFGLLSGARLAGDAPIIEESL